MKIHNRTERFKVHLQLPALAVCIAALLALPSARADTTIDASGTFTIDDSNTTVVDSTTTWNDTGTLTINNDGTLQTWPNQNGEVANNDAIVFAGSGGTYILRFNDNDTKFTLNGAMTSTATGAQTLALSLGDQGNGDRESVVFNSGIPDVGDSSALSLNARFTTQSGSESYLSLPGINTFTGPITLVKGDNVQNAYLTVGGVLTKDGNTPGSGNLGNGTYAGAIALDTTTHLYYDSSADQILAGAISGAGALDKDGSGTLTLSGLNTYVGNTTVSSGELVLNTTGTLTFGITDVSNNKITGTATAALNGTFTIDTSAFSGAVGSWTLVDVTTVSYGGTFSVAGYTKAGTVWTNVVGARTWTFDQANGVLSVSAPALVTSFSYLTYYGIVNQDALTISLALPQGTDLTSIAPTYTVSSGTGDPVSGTARNFTSAQTYTITDGASVNTYTVNVSFFAGLTVSTYLGRNDPSDLDPISNLMAATPTATGIQMDDIDYHGGVWAVPANPSGDNFSILWEGWFDVLAAGGHGTYTFGTSSDDGSVIYMDLNRNGSFADPGEYIVNNNNYQGDTPATGQVTLDMDSVHIVIGYYEGGGGYDMRAGWKKGAYSDFDSLDLINGTSGVFFPTDPHPGVGGGYSDWATLYAGGQAANLDYNNDGVENGIAYFMGATGLATNPGVVDGKVSWPHSASATGITYHVLTSEDLADWTDVTADAIDSGGFLTYTLPTATPKLFVRLEVVAP